MSALRLEWKHSPGEEFIPESWHVPVDAIGASVMESGDVYEWSVHFTSGAEPTLLAAQLAAEAAALELLTKAVGAFGVECWAKIDARAGVIRVSDHRPAPFLTVSDADAISLACALLAAAVGVKP